MTTTHRDYDLSEISKSMRGILMGSLMVGLMHLYFGYTNPYVCDPLTYVQSRDPEYSSSEKRHGVQHGQDLDLGYACHGRPQAAFQAARRSVWRHAAAKWTSDGQGMCTDVLPQASIKEAEKVTASIRAKDE